MTTIKEEMATHSNILAWRILWTEEPGGLQSLESQRLRDHLVPEHTMNDNDDNSQSLYTMCQGKYQTVYISELI